MQALLNFFRMEGYEAVTLSTREAQQGFAIWEAAATDGVPIVVANLFRDKRGKKTVFKPYVIKEDHGDRLGVIGMLTESAWKTRRDTATVHGFKPPLEMGKLIKKVAKKTDHLTVTGDFSPAESDTLVMRFPEIDLVVSSGIKSAERPRTVGNTMIIGSGTRGYSANYIDFTFDRTDSTRFHSTARTLDESVPVDSTVQSFVNSVNLAIKNSNPTPKAANAPQ